MLRPYVLNHVFRNYFLLVISSFSFKMTTRGKKKEKEKVDHVCVRIKLAELDAYKSLVNQTVTIPVSSIIDDDVDLDDVIVKINFKKMCKLYLNYI